MSISTNKPLGIPAGGNVGEVLGKASDHNYDFTWVPGGGGSAVLSVFGRINAVVAQSGDYNTDLITETTNLYFTNARAIAALSATTPLVFSSGNLSINQSNTTTSGYISATDFTTFSNKGASNITSVDVSVPSFLAVSNNPITTSGTITIAGNSGQTANYVLATPDGSTGTLSLRALVANDIPSLSAAKITSGVLAMTQGGAPQPPFYGLGQLGDVTISSGTTTLTDDYYVNNLTISGTGQLNPAGYRIFVAGTLDLTNAPANAISRNGLNGNNASGATGGASVTVVSAVIVGGAATGQAGANGTTGTGTAGTGGSGTVNATLGGLTGGGGSGGAPALAVGGAGGNGSTPVYSFGLFSRFDYNLLRGIAVMQGSIGAASGGAGSGSGANSGGGGGGGARGGSVIAIYCNIFKRDTTTAASAISCIGGNGGNGGTATGANAGGGGGGASGPGGSVYICYSQLQGNAATNLIDVSAGTGGTGGDGVGTGRGGQGGQGSSAGRVLLLNMSAGTIAEYQDVGTFGTVPTTPTTTSGTAGTAGTTLQVTF